MRNINYILRKNRRILATLVPDTGKAKINKDKLIDTGFDFKYFTHFHKNQKGKVYKVCFDYGYLVLESMQVLLINCKVPAYTRSDDAFKLDRKINAMTMGLSMSHEFQDSL